MRYPFYYLRHGQTDWNLRGVTQGRSDIPLNAEGRDQVRRAARMIAAQLRIDRVITSPLSRALETAHMVAAALDLPVDIDPDLAECGFGEREGSQLGAWMDDYWTGLATPARAETAAQVTRRVGDAFKRMRAHGGSSMIIAHGGVYKALTLHVEIGPQFHLPNAEPIRLTPDGVDRWRAEHIAASPTNEEFAS